VSASSLLLAVALLSAPEADPPVITHARISSAPLGAAIVVRAKIDDASEIFAPSVLVRPKGAKEYDTLEMRRKGDVFEATIAAEQVVANLEYFIEAFDEHGNGPSRDGSPEEPIGISLFDPTKAPPPPVAVVATETPAPKKDDEGGVHTTWWFWTLVGVALAGGATAAYFIAKPPGVVDFVDISVRGPSPTGE